MFNLNDYNQHPFFTFGRCGLVQGEYQCLDHAMYDLHSPIKKEVHSYDLMDRVSKPTYLRPSFSRAILLLEPEQRDFLTSKLNQYLAHLDESEGLDFENAFLVASPYSVLEHVHTGICFEQTYVCTVGTEPPATDFHVAGNLAFAVPKEDYMMRLKGEPVSHSVVANDTNIKFYFVFEYTRAPKRNLKFDTPYLL